MNRNKTPQFLSNAHGFSLVEIMIAVGVLSILMLAMMTMQSNQVKSNNFLELQIKRSAISAALISQVLNNPENCRCFFQGSSAFNATGTTTTLTVPAAATAIGRYNFVTPGDCSTATIPAPLTSVAGVDSVRLKSVTLDDIVPVGSDYQGKLNIKIASTKDVSGPPELNMSFPVAVTATVNVNPALRDFQGCSLGATASALPLSNCTYEQSAQSWTDNFTTHQVMCPTDKVAVTWSAYATDYIDGNMKMICCSLGGRAWLGSAHIVSSGTTNADDNVEHRAFCGADELLTGYTAYSTSYFDGPVTARCHKFVGVTTTKKVYGEIGSHRGFTNEDQNHTEHVAKCISQNQEVLSGVAMRATTYLDNISRIECSTPMGL